MELIGDGYAPLEASKTIATEDSDGSRRCNATLIERGIKITNKITQSGQIIGASSVSQSALKLRVVLDESILSTTRVLFNATSWIEALPDTSWDEMSHGTSRTEVIHDNSWIVNINWKCLGKNEDDDDPDYEVDNTLSTQQSLGLAINFPWQLRHLLTATTHAETSILDRDAKSSHYRSEPNQAEGKTSPILFLADIWVRPIQPQGIIKKARYGWVSGGSPVPQSTINLLRASTTHLPVDFPCLCEIGDMYNDTSWAQLFHDTSWFVNVNGNDLGNAEDHGEPEYKEDNISSRHLPVGRIIEFTLAIAASSRQPQSWTETPHCSSYYRANPNEQSTRSWAAAPINSTFTEILIGTLSTGGGCYAGRLST